MLPKNYWTAELGSHFKFRLPMHAPQKIRIDQLLLERGKAQSRQRARALILSGKVFANGQVLDKPGTPVSPDVTIVLKGADHPYVSRGGLKLEKALRVFKINVEGLICLDVGASTGGFTDCLLQQGARQVIAVDVGYGQLAWKLRKDPRVRVVERSNIRLMPTGALPSPVDLVTIDVSFISLRIVAPAALKFMKVEAMILALIKPQFEVGKGEVGKGGVVKNPDQHEAVITDLTQFFTQTGLKCGPVIESPLLGPKGNKEFMILLQNSAKAAGKTNIF
jgi:23S rRNA (cytidine1920-2'-O)/16S rRNA (cytidine1409-2'-O)-methyltransferase